MQDLYGEFGQKFEFVIAKAEENAKKWGFGKLSTPVLEFSALFERNLGGESDVVQKEIYKFQDKGGETLALRPEFTAGVVRSFIENSLKTPSRLFSFGPLFRYDRPQKGRYRQFHQINFESIGTKGEMEDALIIKMGQEIIKSIGITSFSLEINHLGSRETLNNYKVALREFFTQNYAKLSELSRQRLEKNPLRILDSKEEEDIEISKNAPKISSFYAEEEAKNFAKVQKYLTENGVAFVVNEGIVRGLDYYTGIVFEFTTQMLGSQSAILSGGRYDLLIKEMGGKETPAIGFAGGIERLALLCDVAIKKEKLAFILPLKEDHFKPSFALLNALHANGINARIMDEGAVGKRLERASKEDFESFAIVIGGEEMAKLEDFLNNKNVKIKFKNLMQSKELEGDFEYLKLCLK
jgi:histidyl-tRNA synthetase